MHLSADARGGREGGGEGDRERGVHTNIFRDITANGRSSRGRRSSAPEAAPIDRKRKRLRGKALH